MSYMNDVNRRGSYANRPPRQSRYPQWGMEEPRRVWNGHSLYRGGERGLFTRYIISPRGERLLRYGMTVGDVAVALGVAAFLYALSLLMGIGLDNYLGAMGY